MIGGNAAHPCAGLVESLHGDSEALSFLSDEVRCRNSAVLEYNVTGIGGTDTHLVLLMSCGETRSSGIYQEHGDSLYPFGFIGHGCHAVEGSDTAVRDEAFSAV